MKIDNVMTYIILLAIGTPLGYYMVTQSFRELESAEMEVKLVYAFLLFGFLVLFLCFAGYYHMGLYLVRVMRRWRLRRNHPKEPWLWRPEWKEKLIPNETSSSLLAWAWIAVGGFILYVTVINLPSRSNFLIAGFLAAAVVMGIGLIALADRRKYRRSHCLLDTLPGHVGGDFRARVISRLPSTPAGGITATIGCVHVYDTASGRYAEEREDVIWVGSSHIAMDAASQLGDRRWEIPIAFTIPTGLPSSTARFTPDRYIWKLGLQGDTPGINYDIEFEVPVFDTTEPPPLISTVRPADGATFQSKDTRTAERELQAIVDTFHLGPVDEPDGQIRIERIEDRLVMRKPPPQTITGIVFCMAMVAGGFVWIVESSIGLGFSAGHGLGFLMIFIFGCSAVWHAAADYSVNIGPTETRIRKSICGIPRERIFQNETIVRIQVYEDNILANVPFTVRNRHAIAMGTQKGNCTLFRKINGRREAEWYAQYIRSCLGLKDY